ncbi:MAG: UDP diphosphate synthase, partial [Haloferacaceae archaeon]
MNPYDRWLALRVRARRRRGGGLPESVAVVITERDLLEQGAYDTLERFLGWAFDYGAERVAVSVSVLDEAVVPTIERALGDVEAPRRLEVRGPGDTEPVGAPVQVNVGLGGKREFAAATRALAHEVSAGELAPEDVDADAVERRLVFPEEPDLLI